MSNTESSDAARDERRLRSHIRALDRKIAEQLKAYQTIKGGCQCFPFLRVDITAEVVNDVFEDLRTKHKDCGGRLNVIVDSGGGDIDAAYNLAMLLRKYGARELNFVVPRWAKSAATLLVCSGDAIVMSPVAELGPLDPQITELNPLERRLEQFSPLHIRSTLDMIRQEFDSGSEKLARALIQRLQFPLTLGRFVKYHEVAGQYLIKLLETRMLSGNKRGHEPSEIAERLTTGYADHGFCINVDEAKGMGLNATEAEGEELEAIWAIYRLADQRYRLQREMREKKIQEMIKELPPSILEELPTSSPEEHPAGTAKGREEGQE